MKSLIRRMVKERNIYVCLDLTPKGRNETGPNYDLGDWVRHHDKYGDVGKSTDSGCGSAERRENKCEE